MQLTTDEILAVLANRHASPGDAMFHPTLRLMKTTGLSPTCPWCGAAFLLNHECDAMKTETITTLALDMGLVLEESDPEPKTAAGAL